MYNHQIDSLTKFPFLKHPKKFKLKHITFDTNLNSLITNPKLITPLYYTHMNIIGQRPKIKVTKTSIASFKIRPNMPVGTHSTTQCGSYLFNSLLKNLTYSFLPGIKRQVQILEPKLTSWSENSNSCQISYGIENLNFLHPFFYLPPMNSHLGGANIAITSHYSKNHFYLPLHSFFLSTKSLYWSKK